LSDLVHRAIIVTVRHPHEEQLEEVRAVAERIFHSEDPDFGGHKLTEWVHAGATASFLVAPHGWSKDKGHDDKRDEFVAYLQRHLSVDWVEVSYGFASEMQGWVRRDVNDPTGLAST
jgi:hypothetical protein